MEEITGVAEIASILREEIMANAQDVKDLMLNECHKEGADVAETHANIMIAYRHLEDATLRLGKVMHAQGANTSKLK